MTQRAAIVLITFVLLLLPVAAPAASSASTRKVSSVKIYLVNIHGKGLGCGGGLVAVRRHIAPTAAPLAAALKQLLANRHPCGQVGLCTAFSRSRLAVGRVSVKRGQATIHLTGKLNLGGVCDIPRVKGQLRATALQFSSVHTVTTFINDVPLSRALSQR